MGGGGRTNSVPPVVGYTYKYKYALINISICVDISDMGAASLVLNVNLLVVGLATQHGLSTTV